jgi:hypothetical protein
VSRYCLAVVLTFLAGLACAADLKISATKDKTSPTGVYIPTDLEDCFLELKKMLPEKTVTEMKSGPEKDMIKYHFGLGTWMRNNWGLWAGSRLRDYLHKLGLRHPDDMSSVILKSFWRHLNGKPLKIDEQVKYYQEYWDKMKKKQKKRKPAQKKP